jgi:hypothetical protein
VDKHIRRLDSDLTRFEAEIQDKAAAGSSRSADETGGHKSELSSFLNNSLNFSHFKLLF